MNEAEHEHNADRGGSGVVTPGGDDERESRGQIAKTGEPKRDEQGNEDGAS